MRVSPSTQMRSRGQPRTFAANGTDLFAEEFGPERAPAALLLSGGPGCSHEYMNPIGDRFSDRLRSFALDTRGWGRSGRPDPRTVSHASAVADYDAVRAALGLEKWILVGHSYGGFLGLEYALAYPDRLAGLVLIGSGSAMDMGHLVAQNVDRLEGKYPRAVRAFASGWHAGGDAAYDAHMREILPLFFKDFDAKVAAPLLESRFSAHAAHEWGHALGGYDVTDRLGEIRCPTLVIDGIHDFILPPAQQRRLHEGIPGSTLVMLDSSGHFPFLEDPVGFDAALRGWLDAAGLR